MKTWVCTVCGWIYDEAKGDSEHDLAPGVKFEDLPDDFVCPLSRLVHIHNNCPICSHLRCHRQLA